MEQLLNFIGPLLTFVKKHKKQWSTLLLVAVISIGVNKEEIWELVSPKTDVAKEYLEKTFVIENDLRKIQEEFEADNASVFLLHNGTVTLNHIHLMKMTMLFSTGDDASLNKQTYRNIPLSPWVDNFIIMMRKGHFLIPNAETSDDPLIRDIYKQTGRKTLIYLPVLDKDNHIVGFCLVSYKRVKVLSDKEIKDLKRFVDKVEAHLN